MDATAITDALQLLDAADDSHWTKDGAPVVDVVAGLVGDKNLKREDITSAAPHFSRSNPTLEVAPAAPPEDKVETAAADQLATVEEAGEESDMVSIDDLSREELLAVTMEDLNGDRDLLKALGARIETEAAAMLAEVKKAEKLARVMSRASSQIKTFLMQSEPKATSGVAAFLAQNQKSRLAKVERAQRFVQAGTTAKDVAAELNAAAPIDVAMKARKVDPKMIRRPRRLKTGG